MVVSVSPVFFLLCLVPWIQSRCLSKSCSYNLKKALGMLCNHTSKEHHKAAIVKVEEFKRSMSSQQPGIQQRLIKVLANRITSNRQKLSCIMETIVLCG